MILKHSSMKIFIFILFLASEISVLAQVALNMDGTSPDNSAMLDIKNTAKGLLIPRMTLAQRNALQAPAPWLLIFQTDITPGVYYNAGTAANPQWAMTGTGGFWSLSGNSGTSVAANFLGTSDNTPLTFRVNNTRSGQIDHLLYNTSLGYQALNSLSGGTHNTAIGHQALYSNSTGLTNTACGTNGLYANTTGMSNAALGFCALLSNTEGSNNTACGRSSLYLNTTGYNNTAIGNQALFSNSTASRNVAIGYSSLESQSYNNGGLAWISNNVAIGCEALYSNQPTSTTSGVENTAIGSSALRSNTIGFSNTATGFKALYFNTTGNHNTALGNLSLYSNTGGVYNTSCGYKSLELNSSGGMNTASGYGALRSNETGSNNTACGTFALYYNDTQGDNTALGYSAGDYYKSEYGTFVGRSAYPNASGYTNTTGLGYNARSTGSNQVRIGNSAVTSIGGYAGWTNFSDQRYKTSIQENVKGLVFIMKLRPVTYKLDINKLAADLQEDMHRGADGNAILDLPSLAEVESRNEKSLQVQAGFLAQEVESAALSIGFEFSGVDVPENPDDYYGLRYAEFVVPLVKAVQEQQVIIDELKKRIIELEKNQLMIK